MNILLDECAVDFVPKSWTRDSKIANYFQKYKRLPLRNGSVHQHLLNEIPKNERYDRPDILHFGLLTLLGYTKVIPQLNIYFSCPRGMFYVDNQTRLPRDQYRFYGLIENIFLNDGSNQFISKRNLNQNINEVLLFSSRGQNISKFDLSKYDTFVFGGFAYGDLRDKYPEADVASLSEVPLDLWTSLTIFLNLFK